MPNDVIGKMEHICRTRRMPSGIDWKNIVITVVDNKFFIREGTHRVLAMLFLGRNKILPKEYNLVFGPEHEEHVRKTMLEYPELKSRRTVIELAIEFGDRIIEAAKNWRFKE